MPTHIASRSWRPRRPVLPLAENALACRSMKKPICPARATVPISRVPANPRHQGREVSLKVITLEINLHRRRFWGSIPACAGESHRGCCGTSTSRVYPRVCGGILTVTSISQPSAMSSNTDIG